MNPRENGGKRSKRLEKKTQVALDLREHIGKQQVALVQLHVAVDATALELQEIVENLFVTN